MALDSELIVAELTPFPDGTCWNTPQEFADLLISHLVLVFNDTAGNTFFNFGPGPIDPVNYIYPWLKTDGAGNPVGWFIFVGGVPKQVPGYPVYYDAAGGPVAFTVTTQENFTLSTQFANREFWIKFPMAPTGAVTINFDTVGPVDIFKNVNQNIGGGDWLANQIVPIVWDAVQGAFQLGWPPSISIYIAGRVPSAVAVTATALTAADTLVATNSATPLVLPAGMQWKWIKVVFSSEIFGVSPGNNSSMGGFKIIENPSGTPLSLSQNPPTSLYSHAEDDDHVMVKLEAEGQPTGFEFTTPLTLEVWASFTLAWPNGDDVAQRAAYIIGEYGP